MRRLIVVAVIALALVRVRTAAACSCSLVDVVVGEAQRVLPRESTLYVWTIPDYVEGPAEVAVTLDGAPVPYDLVLVHAAARYSVYRLRIHAPDAGKLVVTPKAAYDEPVYFTVVEELAARHPLQVERVSFHGLPTPWCGPSGWFVSIDGEAPAAYHLRGTLEGQPVDAYLPARGDFDDDGLPAKGRHQVPLTLGYCGVWWLDPDKRLENGDDVQGARWTDVVLSRLELDGTEVEIARGELDLGTTMGVLPTFASPVWPEPPPPPPPVATPAPVVAWWPVGAGAGGGLVLGGLGWLGLARRRRSR